RDRPDPRCPRDRRRDRHRRRRRRGARRLTGARGPSYNRSALRSAIERTSVLPAPIDDGPATRSPLRATALLAIALGLPGCHSMVATAGVAAPLGKALVEIGIFFVLFMIIFWFMRGTRGENILKGIAT